MAGMETTQHDTSTDDDRYRPTVDEAVNAVAAEIEPVAKSERAGSGSYSYRGIDRILDALAPIMARHQVTVVPAAVSDVHHEWVSSPSRSNPDRVEGFTRGTYTFQVRGPRGDTDAYTGQYHAHGMNDRDKSPGSMASYAYRNFVSLLFRIPTAQSDTEARDEHPVTTEKSVSEHQANQIIEMLNNVPDEADRRQAKHDFLAVFEIGSPFELQKSRFEQALRWIAPLVPEPFDADTGEPDTDEPDTAADEPADTDTADVTAAADADGEPVGVTDDEAAVLEALLATGSGNSNDIAAAMGQTKLSAKLRTAIAALAERNLIELDSDAEQGRGPLRVWRRNEPQINESAPDYSESETA